MERNDGQTGGHGFEDDEAKGIGAGGKEEDVHFSVRGGECGAAKNSGEAGVGEALLQPFALAAIANNEEPDASEDIGGKTPGKLHEKPGIFLRRQATGISQRDSVP